jgi:hypothetical protein
LTVIHKFKDIFAIMELILTSGKGVEGGTEAGCPVCRLILQAHEEVLKV